MDLPQNNWDAIRCFYAIWHDDIMRAGRNEWAGDAYDWDVGIIHFTPIESWLWHDIRSCDAVLYPQYPVGRFFVDFANPVARVAVECDGRQWHQDKAKDAERDRRLRAMGWEIYRISGSDCRVDTSITEDGDFINSPGAELIQRICDRHGISRFSRTADEAVEDWEPMEVGVMHIFERLKKFHQSNVTPPRRTR